MLKKMFCIGTFLAGFIAFAAAQVQEKTVKGMPLFEGKTLNGWKTLRPEHNALWKVEDSVIVGGDGINKVKGNVYLYTDREYGDFELRCLFRLTGDPSTGMINSGIQYRSQVIEGRMTGYQADIGEGFWGDIYDEHRRKKLVSGDLSVLRHVLRPNDWNSYIVRVRGNHHELYINGVKTADYIERDPSIPARGVIGIQLHGGGAARIEFRDVTLSFF